MHPVIKGQLTGFTEANGVSDLSQSDAFEIFTIHCCLNGFKCENIDPFECHLQGSEFGIDGIAIMVQGKIITDLDGAIEAIESIRNPRVEFHFFQSKTGSKFQYGEVSTFLDAVKYFFSDELEGESAQIDELLEIKNYIYSKAVTDKNPSLSCYFATTGNYDEPSKIEKRRASFISEMKQLVIFDDDEISTHFAGAGELQKWFRSASSSNVANIHFPNNEVLPGYKDLDEGYIGYIDAANLLKLYTEISENEISGPNKTVFFDNIRDYNPKSKINIQIKESIRSDSGASFVYRNNGVTVVARSIKRTSNNFTLSEYQIVNGCQTSNIVLDYTSELIFEKWDPETEKLSDFIETELSDFYIPIRIIGSTKDDFINSIIIGTNQQNPVKNEQFWALSPYVKGLEEYFVQLSLDEVLYLERRENQYVATNVERTRIISTSVLMKSVTACILRNPHRASRDFKKAIEENREHIFKDSHDVRVYHAICFLYYRLDFMWRNQRINDVPKSYRYYILSGVFDMIVGKQNIFSFKHNEIIKKSEELIKSCKKDDEFSKLIYEIKSVLDSVLKNENSSTNEEVRDSLRASSVFKKFENRIAALKSTGSTI